MRRMSEAHFAVLRRHMVDVIAIQAELADLSTDSLHQVIEGATHSSLVFNPDHAGQVSAGILQVVEAVRLEKRLAE